MHWTVAVFTAFAQGCAMCRTALESSPEGRLLAGSFAQGILMLMFLPYIIFGTIAFAIYRAYRKKGRSAADGAPKIP
jgi:hypothetical protein